MSVKDDLMIKEVTSSTAVFAVVSGCVMLNEYGYESLELPHLVVFLTAVAIVAALSFFYFRQQRRS